jgi:hypothetical protein
MPMTPPSRRCAKSYDGIKYNISVPDCGLLSSHNDYSAMLQLPKFAAVYTSLRDPVHRVLSTYEFAVEVSSRKAVSIIERKKPDPKQGRVSTDNVWPWSYLVPFLEEDMLRRVRIVSTTQLCDQIVHARHRTCMTKPKRQSESLGAAACDSEEHNEMAIAVKSACSIKLMTPRMYRIARLSRDKHTVSGWIAEKWSCSTQVEASAEDRRHGRWVRHKLPEGGEAFYNGLLNTTVTELSEEQRKYYLDSPLPAIDVYNNDLYMPLKTYIQHETAYELLHNGQTLQACPPALL